VCHRRFRLPVFLQPLPQEIRVLLSEDEWPGGYAGYHRLSRPADCHACPTGPRCVHHGVGGRRAGAGPGGSNRCKKKLPPTQHPQQQQGGSSQRGSSFHYQPTQAAIPRTLMCFYHTRSGERAKYCEEGCLWPEN
jgi:hypothetical protein